MPFSYKPMFKTMIDRDMSRDALRKATGAATSTFTRIWKGEPISLDLLDRLCTVLDCPVEAILEHEKPPKS